MYGQQTKSSGQNPTANFSFLNLVRTEMSNKGLSEQSLGVTEGLRKRTYTVNPCKLLKTLQSPTAVSCSLDHHRHRTKSWFCFLGLEAAMLLREVSHCGYFSHQSDMPGTKAGTDCPHVVSAASLQKLASQQEVSQLYKHWPPKSNYPAQTCPWLHTQQTINEKHVLKSSCHNWRTPCQ